MKQNNNNNRPTARKRVLMSVTLAVLCMTLLLLLYVASVVVRGWAAYDKMNYRSSWAQNVLHTESSLIQMDSELGYRLLPGAEGKQLLLPRTLVPFFHDDEGLRVAAGVRHQFDPTRKPTLLFLGDSFSYGQLVVQPKTFAALVGKQLHAQSLDAAVPGYGLAQMVLQAQRIVPRYLPDILVVQYSAWLASRASSPYANDTGQLVPVPYYYAATGAADSLIIAPQLYQLPASWGDLYEHYKWQPLDWHHRLGFIAEMAWPLYLRRDAGVLAYGVKRLLGKAPVPVQDQVAIVRTAYASLARIAQANHAKLVILVLGTARDLQLPPAGTFPPDALVVNGWQAMVDQLQPVSKAEYQRQYYFWGGTPPQIVDWHPNEKAHQIIAATLSDAIRKAGWLPVTGQSTHADGGQNE